MWRVLDREAVEDPAVGAHLRKSVERADGARMVIEQLTEVRFSQPSVDVGADLDAHRPGNVRRASKARCEEDLAEASLPDHSLDLVADLRFGADDDLPRGQHASGFLERQKHPARTRRCPRQFSERTTARHDLLPAEPA